MTTEGINSPINIIRQEEIPPSVTNRMATTTEKGCEKNAGFFNKIFSSIGNFFKKVGNFLWNNKVTVAVCSFFSAIILGISALFLSLFGKKKVEIKETAPQETNLAPVRDNANGKSKRVDDQQLQQDPLFSRPAKIRKTNESQEIETLVPQHLQQEHDDTQINPTIINGGLVTQMLQQLQEAKQDETEKQDENNDTLPRNTGLVARMQHQLQEAKQDETEKQNDDTKATNTGLVARMQHQLQEAKLEETEKQDDDTKATNTGLIARMQQQLQEAKQEETEQQDDDTKATNTGLVARMQHQLQEAKLEETEKQDDDTKATNTGLVERMQHQLEESKNEESVHNSIDIRASADFNKMHSMLAGKINLLPGQQPQIRRRTQADGENRKNTQDLSDILKSKPPRRKTRAPSRRTRTSQTEK